MGFLRRFLGDRGPPAPPGPPLRERTAGERLALIHAYHEATRHDFQRFAAGPYELDWDTQPDPFQRWIGTELLPLEHVPLEEGPSFEDGWREGATASAPLTARSLARFFEDSLALAAWKEAGGARWALRVPPSSGNLHPTEAHAILPAIERLCDSSIVAHYAPREHAIEVRARVPAERFAALAAGLPAQSFFVVLTSIAWREAWKYGERAWRYCQLDLGHAIAALAFAAAGLGWRARLLDRIGTRELAAITGLGASSGPELEWPACLVAVVPSACDVERWAATSEDCLRWSQLSWQGRPSELSSDHVLWDAIDAAREACAKPWGAEIPRMAAEARASPAADSAGPGLRGVLRQRRSALGYDGRTSLSLPGFLRLLARTRAGSGATPFATLGWRPLVDLCACVHRVDDLAAGSYYVVRDGTEVDALRGDFSPRFLWERIANEHEGLELFRLASGDLRARARAIACHQEIASDGCFSAVLYAAFESALATHGAWAWARLHWEAGALAHALYLQAEVEGLRATGIGCFFDEPTRELLGATSRARRCLYQYALGAAVEDARLTTLPPYDSPPGDAAARGSTEDRS